MDRERYRYLAEILNKQNDNANETATYISVIVGVLFVGYRNEASSAQQADLAVS